MNEGSLRSPAGGAERDLEGEIPFDVVGKLQTGVQELSIPWTCSGCGREDVLQGGVKGEWV